MTASTMSAISVTDGDLVPIWPTTNAQWLAPSAWPDEYDWLFQPRPFDRRGPHGVISRYADVLQVIRDEDVWHRSVSLEALPRNVRHCAMDASWASDGGTHEVLRHSLRVINRGSTRPARQFTRAIASELLARLLREPPPWDLARVIYPSSMRVVIEHTLKAPPLLSHAPRLQELVHESQTGPDGYLGVQRQPELEDILLQLADPRRYDELPSGTARHLVDLYRAGELDRWQLAGQLSLLVISHDTQATAAASLIGMLLEHDDWSYARTAAAQPTLMRRIIDEGDRRGLTVPVMMLTPTADVGLDGQIASAGEPVLVSTAAANLDPERFGKDALSFDIRTPRRPHIAFGIGPHRCLGATVSDQFVEDLLVVMLDGLPPDITLDNGTLLREVAGITWSVPCLPVVPSAAKPAHDA